MLTEELQHSLVEDLGEENPDPDANHWLKLVEFIQKEFCKERLT